MALLTMTHPTGSWGPDAVHDLIAPRAWHLSDS
jgi:hypothetical protein